MEPNLIIIALAAFIPMATAMLWYNPKVFGTVWMNESGLNEKKLQGGNMFLILSLCYIYACLMGFIISNLVIHQAHIYSILVDEVGFGQEGSPAQDLLDNFMIAYGDKLRTFSHGVFHGTLTGILLVLPVVATSALFEQRSFKYVLIVAGYWVLNLALMGGVICQFS